MSKRAIVWIASLFVLAAAAAVGVWKFRGSGEPEIRYETAPVERGRVRSHVTSSGTLSALVTVQVGSQVSGRIEKLNADFNSVVKKGDVIAKIEPQLFDADVRKARANLLAASGNMARVKAEADLADRQAARAKELRANGISSQSDLDTAESAAVAARAQLESLKGALEQARAALHQAEINLAYTTIKSPIDGVVISRSVDVGQTVAASLSAPTLFTIAEDLRKMQVDTFVAEADVGKLRPTMEATFTVDAFPGRRFKGTVREIRNAPQTVQNVVTYDAVIDVDNSALELKPGMTANVTIIVAEKDDALKVPNAALRFRPGPELVPSGSAGGGRPPRGKRGRPAASASGEASADSAPPDSAPPDASSEPDRDDPDTATRPSWRTVWVLRGPRPQPVRVRAGLTDGTNTEIVEGDLQPGEELVVSSSGGESQGPASNPRGSSPGGGRRLF